MIDILKRLKYVLPLGITNNSISLFNITTYKLLYYGLGIQRNQIIENSEDKNCSYN